MGSVRTVLDGAGAVQSTTSYDPWGVPVPPVVPPGVGGGSPAPFGFTGELHDGDLVHLRARWYHPSTGTFTSRDPFAGFDTQPYSLHPYQYAYSNPVLLTDPSGRCVAPSGHPRVCPVPTPEPDPVVTRTPTPASSDDTEYGDAGAAMAAAAILVPKAPIPPVIIAGAVCVGLVGIAASMPDFAPRPVRPAAQGVPFPLPPVPPAETRPDLDIDQDVHVDTNTDVRFGQPTPTPDTCTKSMYWYDDPESFDPTDPTRKRAVRAQALLCNPLGKGTSFAKGREKNNVEGRIPGLHDRGHLIAKELGGRGIKPNGVPLFPNVNQDPSRYRQIEQDVKNAVLNRDDIVHYIVTPIYDDSSGPNPVPIAIWIVANGQTVNYNEYLPNTP